MINNELYLHDVDIAIKNTLNIEALNNHRVLITGASGTVGSFVSDMLIRYNICHQGNISVYVAGRNVNKLKDLFPSANCLKYDIFDELNFKEEFDYIIHAAGNAHPSAFLDDPVGTIVGNIDSTKKLLDYLKNHNGTKMLYISSGEIYCNKDMSIAEIKEDYFGHLDILNPRFCYPISKLAAENLCVSYTKQYGIQTVIARLCHTFGPNITDADSRAHAQFFNEAIKGNNIVLKSKGTQLRSYNYVADCASAILTVLIKGISGEAYNISNPSSIVTVAELADIIANNTGVEVVFDIPSEKDIIMQSPISKQVLSSSKLQALGWKPVFDIESGIVSTINIIKGINNYEKY